MLFLLFSGGAKNISYNIFVHKYNYADYELKFIDIRKLLTLSSLDFGTVVGDHLLKDINRLKCTLSHLFGQFYSKAATKSSKSKRSSRRVLNLA